MATRRKKSIEELDPDFAEDGTPIPRIFDTLIIKPIERMGIAYEPASLKNPCAYITYMEEGTGENKKLYAHGYHGSILTALNSLYIHVVNIRVAKSAKQKKEELELSEVKAIIVKTEKEFNKLWLRLK